MSNPKVNPPLPVRENIYPWQKDEMEEGETGTFYPKEGESTYQLAVRLRSSLYKYRKKGGQHYYSVIMKDDRVEVTKGGTEEGRRRAKDTPTYPWQEHQFEVGESTLIKYKKGDDYRRVENRVRAAIWRHEQQTGEKFKVQVWPDGVQVTRVEEKSEGGTYPWSAGGMTLGEERYFDPKPSETLEALARRIRHSVRYRKRYYGDDYNVRIWGSKVRVKRVK